MTVTGAELLQRAGEILVSGDPSERVQALIARRSRHVLDSLNLERSTTVGGVVKVPVDLPVPADPAAGTESFTWGPGGDVDRLPPSEVRAWSYVNTSGEEIARSGPAAMLNTEQYASTRFAYTQPQPDPLYLYWPRTLDNGRYTFHVVPPASRAMRLFVYAFMPRLADVDPGMEYELDGGVASYLIYQLAIDAAPVLGLTLPPEAYQAALAAADRIGRFGREQTVLQAAPRWLIGNPYWERRRIFRGERDY